MIRESATPRPTNHDPEPITMPDDHTTDHDRSDAPEPLSLRSLADPDCPRCHGTGKVLYGPNIMDSKRCQCGIQRQRLDQYRAQLARAVTPEQLTLTLDTWPAHGDPRNDRALHTAMAFVQNYSEAMRRGWTIGYRGLPGSGANHLATGIAIDCALLYGATVYVTTLSDLLEGERQSYGQGGPRSTVDRACRVDVLAVTELGDGLGKLAGENVSWAAEQLYHILDHRIMHCRPTIYTTSDSLSVMERRLGSESGIRVLSRLERNTVPGFPVEVVRRSVSR